MKLSIIIPVYNVEDYVECTVNSCLEQDYNESEYEIICIDDGSTDNSLEILKKYKNRKNFRVISQANGGVSVARNRGIEEAQGKYLWFIDSDDFIMKNCISQIMSWADEHPDVDMIQWELKRTIDEAERFLEKKINVSKIFSSGVELSDFLPEEQRGFSCAYWIKKSVIKENQLHFPVNVIMCEDECFNFYIRKCVKKSAFISTKVYFYRTRESSVTNNIHKKSSITKYVESRIELATYNAKKVNEPKNISFKKEIEERILYDVQGAISMSISTGDLHYIKDVLKNLTDRGLYPYQISFKKLLPHNNFRKYMIDFLAIMYPYKFFVYVYGVLYKFVNYIISKVKGQ